MCILRRFPVSDEFILDCKMFCVILDRKEIFEIFNYVFFIIGHVTTEDMEMSEIALRIEWKHFQIPAGPASGRNCPLKSQNLGFGHIGTFFRSFRKFEKWEVPKKMLPIRSKLFLGGWNRSGVNRWPGGRAMSGNGQVPREKHTCGRFASLDIPFSTLLVFDCRDPGFAPRNGERWSWVTQAH